MRKNIHITYSFIVDNPNILGQFLLFVGQDQLGEDYLIYSHIWGSHNTLGKKYALHIQEIQAPSTEKPQIPENRRKIGKKLGISYFLPIFLLFFPYFSYFLPISLPTFWNLGFF